jgi:hypothetical protein
MDAWRLSEGWEPIGLELVTATERYFDRWDPSQPPSFMPGRPVELEDTPTDLRMATVTVRSKSFRVFFRYVATPGVFEVLRIIHPRAK